MVQKRWKQSTQLHRYLVYAVAYAVVLFYSVSITSCTKPDEERPVAVDTLPLPPSTPTGTIKDFTIADTLVGHGRQTNIKWYVEGTNNVTEVRLNGEKVSFSGAMQSGPLTKNTTFTLTINNGKQSSKMVYVTDSLSTLLWNDGIRWRTVGTRTERSRVIKGSAGQDSTIYVWESTFDSATTKKYEHYRTSFYLTGKTFEEQLTTNFPQPNPASRTYFVSKIFNTPVDGTGYAIFQWKDFPVYIDTISLAARVMVLRMDTVVNGRVTYNRVRYVPEF